MKRESTVLANVQDHALVKARSTMLWIYLTKPHMLNNLLTITSQQELENTSALCYPLGMETPWKVPKHLM